MAIFVFSPAAVADLDDIWEYTCIEWGPDQAERYLGDVKLVCQGLASGLNTGKSAQDIRDGYRKALAGSHMLYFRILDNQDIDIIRILHQKMDVTRRFS